MYRRKHHSKTLADLSSLWAEAQVYTSQLSAIDLKGQCHCSVSDIPGKEWKGKIEFANPEIVSDSRLNLVRVSIPNPKDYLNQMPAYVSIKSKELNTPHFHQTQYCVTVK